MANNSARTSSKSSKSAPRQGVSGGVTAGVTAIFTVIALAVGIILGKFVLGGGGAGVTVGKTSLTEAELDTVVATYTYEGQRHDITARQVIENTSSLESALLSDGTYAVPTADDVLAIARNEILASEAEKLGITVTAEEVDEYAIQTLGTADYATIAANYGLTEDVARSLIENSAVMAKLRESVVTTQLPEYPSAPSAPEDGSADTASAEYAAYVIALAGDEWDAENDTWASTDGTFYTALSAYPISNDSATYEAATAAYYVAASNYAAVSQQVSAEWTAYVNSILSGATLELGSLVA